MADLVAGTCGWEAGELSKQADEWVLATEAHDLDGLRGFMFSTLERIGGTPALVIGMAAVDRHDERAAVVRALLHENYHKALMAFPDEDVLVASRIVAPGPFAAMTDLNDLRPWPGVRANGEERAWGRRLSKRFGSVDFDDRAMVARGGDGDVYIFDYEPAIRAETTLPDDLDPGAGEYVIAWGWAMAEFLAGIGQSRS